MLFSNQLERYYQSREISLAAREYIKEARDSEPSRMVGANARSNVCSWVVSNKMGRSISTESHTAERAFISLAEFDERILEFWDQPPPVKIEKVNRQGKVQGVSYTPDFLCLTKDQPEVVEVKHLNTLNELVIEQPRNWVKTESGGFQYLPAVRSFKKIGLEHRVFAYSSDLTFRVANLDLISWSRKLPQVEPSLPYRLSLALEEACCWDLESLKSRLDLQNYGPLLQLIDRGVLVADLDLELLSSPRDCHVASTMCLLEQGREIRKQHAIYSDNSTQAVALVRVPRESDARKTLEKLEKLENQSAPERTLRRWKSLISKGTESGLSPFQSLLPSHFRSGNRQRKISKRSEEFLTEFLTNTFAQAQGLSKYRGYIRYVHEATLEDPPIETVCRTTFETRLRQIPASVIAAGRCGRRGKNAASESSDPMERALKPALPWQKCAIDHYKADIMVIIHSSQNMVYVARPWITGMIDLATGKLLALTVSLRDPSRVACAKVMRECVRRHRRLPAEIIVDRGSDFKSVFFSSLLAHYRITLSLRPAAHPRFGGEVEGFFGEFKKQWLAQRSGNLADYKEARSVDGEKAPAKSAILSPFDLYQELQHFAAWRDAKPKPLKLSSNSELFERGQDEFPFVGISVNNGPEFRLATSVESRKYRVCYERGFHIGDAWYFSPSIASVRGKKTKLDVRCDPENPHLIHALIGDRWEPCFSSQINSFSALSPLSQFEQGLVAIEGRSLKRKVKELADIDLARLCSEMDSVRETGQTPVIPVAESELMQPVEEGGIGELDFSNLRKMRVEAWHAQY